MNKNIMLILARLCLLLGIFLFAWLIRDIYFIFHGKHSVEDGIHIISGIPIWLYLSYYYLFSGQKAFYKKFISVILLLLYIFIGLLVSGFIEHGNLPKSVRNLYHMDWGY